MRAPSTKRLHECGAPGCKEEVSNAHVMCRAHWFRTPRYLREAINDAWKASRTSDWSNAIMEARRWHADNPPASTAALAARITGEQL